MERRQKGFTLVELVVILLIIGILAVLALPQYSKSIESSKAEDALAIAQMIGTTNRLYYIQNQIYTAGKLDDTCTSYCCEQTVGCPTPPPAGQKSCNLIACRYLAPQPFDNRPYDLYALDPTAGGADLCGLGSVNANHTACAKRKTGSPPGTTDVRYTGWGYIIDLVGAIQTFTNVGQPSPPAAPPAQ